MSELKKIAYNCKKATYLIEKKLIGEITIREKLELKLHLAGCSICRTFERQSLIINQMVKVLFKDGQKHNLKLDNQFKTKLQQRLENELKK
ncbi:hypothetical protein DHW03_10610 [Pedobacter yonginense]|uniref:Zinc-finger domain-containing protein n=1 Tax=Pedobacter yonginense TaxID=651869 RepID=A0A317ESM5_9SPHI|nr:zf-HC2 domain-containing protein [Pedobacter yonginense]PWS28266.1 hypothetical protein DHW03_10610 [Pedobacter yonginense]